VRLDILHRPAKENKNRHALITITDDLDTSHSCSDTSTIDSVNISQEYPMRIDKREHIKILMEVYILFSYKT
jgi:hypothetical protein